MQASKRPTVLQVLPALISGGVERGTVEVARAITMAGGRALVASSGGALVASAKHAGAEHFTLPLTSKNPFRMWLNAQALERIIKRERVDIVHARSRAPAWSAYFAAKRAGAHFITTFHGVYGLEKEWKRKYNSIMTRGERVIAISHFIAQHMREEYATPPERIRIIHRGVDMNIFHPGRVHPERMAALAREWRVPEDVPVIVFPGRITRWKGHGVFIEALARLPHRRFLALLVGDDTGHAEYRQELEKLVATRELEGCVRMVGATPRMAEAYTLSRFVVATSTAPEAFGRVVLEAQAMGRAVIATNHGGARETVLPDVTGWLVNPGDPQALAERIAYALAAPDAQLSDMGMHGMEHARQFTAERMCQQTLEVYGEVLASTQC